VAGVARMGTGLALVARSVPTCPGGRRGFLRGRRGTWRHPSSFTWQAWYLVTSTFVSRGRRGTITHAGVALGDMDRYFAWQAWHVWHWALGDMDRIVTLRGWCGTYGTGLALVARSVRRV